MTIYERDNIPKHSVERRDTASTQVAVDQVPRIHRTHPVQEHYQRLKDVEILPLDSPHLFWKAQRAVKIDDVMHAKTRETHHLVVTVHVDCEWRAEDVARAHVHNVTRPCRSLVTARQKEQRRHLEEYCLPRARATRVVAAAFAHGLLMRDELQLPELVPVFRGAYLHHRVVFPALGGVNGRLPAINSKDKGKV